MSLALWPALPPGLAAAIGAAGAVAIVRALSRGAFDPARLILAGVAVGSLLAGITGLVLALAPGDRVLRSATFWLFGGIGTPRWSVLAVPALLLVASTAWLLASAERLDRLTLGQDIATSLGVDVIRLRRGVLLVAIALTATAVAAAGIIGFVGLIAPHVARRWVGAPHRQLLPVAALGGAILVTTADVAARTLFAPREVPVGLLTAAVGGPFFVAAAARCGVTAILETQRPRRRLHEASRGGGRRPRGRGRRTPRARRRERFRQDDAAARTRRSRPATRGTHPLAGRGAARPVRRV